MNVRIFILSLCGFVCSSPVVAEIYKCTDDSGIATFTDNPRSVTKKQCVSMNLEPMIINAPVRNKTTKSGSTRSTRVSPPVPSSFPRVDSGTQQKRDVTRRQVLEDEMATEQRLLGDSQRNVDLYQRQGDNQRLTQSRNEVVAHQKNIEALQKELQRLK